MPLGRGLIVSLGLVLILAVPAVAAAPRPAITPIAYGHLLKLPASVEAALRRDHRDPHIYLIATHDGRNFYRVGDSGRCYGAAPAANLEHVSKFRDPAAALGDYECTNSTTPRVILDLSTWGTSTANPVSHLRGLLGLAANEVHSVALVTATGTIESTVPVVSNLYWAHRVPTNIVGLRALNAAGKVLWQESR